MKALSIRQPWANLIADGQKTIETRTWTTRYRGMILLCSSRRPNIAPAGCCVAVARLVDCRPMGWADQQAAGCGLYDGAYAWVLEDVRPVQPVSVKGALGIFDAPLALDDLVFVG